MSQMKAYNFRNPRKIVIQHLNLFLTIKHWRYIFHYLPLSHRSPSNPSWHEQTLPSSAPMEQLPPFRQKSSVHTAVGSTTIENKRTFVISAKLLLWICLHMLWIKIYIMKPITMLNATNVNSCCISLSSAENKRTIVLAVLSCCIEQPPQLGCCILPAIELCTKCPFFFSIFCFILQCQNQETCLIN